MFLRLRQLLEHSRLPWAVYVSSANHETASIRDAQIVFEEVNELFPSGLFFLGNLSDVAVYNYLQDTTSSQRSSTVVSGRTTAPSPPRWSMVRW